MEKTEASINGTNAEERPLKLTHMKTKSTPELSPGKFLKYNSRAHKILLYARFKNNKPFTAFNYHEFTVDKPPQKRVDEAIRYLSKIGYLNRIAHPNPPIRTLKYIYSITLNGEHALNVVASQEQKRFRKQIEKRNSENAIKRWGEDE
jgi:hypothetical protein